MIVGSPRKLAETPTFRESLRLLFPPERLDAFATAGGVDLRKIDSALIAGFDIGTLYAFSPPSGSLDSITRRFEARILSGERNEKPHPRIQRISGNVGDTPQTLVRLDDFAVAIAVKDPTLGKIAEAFARKKLHNSPPALRGAALSQLGAPPPNSVVTFYAPGPFVDEWARGARGLLADAVAIQVSLTALAGERARIHLELAGDFPASAVDDLALGFRDLAQSSTGKLLALDQLDASPTIREREGRLLLECDFALAPIARGLRAAVIADVWEILDLPRTRESPAP